VFSKKTNKSLIYLRNIRVQTITLPLSHPSSNH
jgi:hypothetical protein